MTGPRTLVCGGRDYADKARVYAVLDEIDPPEIAEGGNRPKPLKDGTLPDVSADWLAAQWARDRGVPRRTYRADWNRWGLSAGPRRNAWALADFAPELVVAFPGGRGTADMQRRAIRAKVTVFGVGR